VMPKPEFLTANGVAIPEPADQFSTVEVVVDQCVLSLTGTTPYNTERLNIGWSGGNNSQGFNEGQNIFLGEPLGDDTLLKDWTATFQLISGANTYNNVNLWDETNQTSNYINVSTTAVGCTYSEPVLTIDGFRGTGNATELVSLDGSTYGLDDGNSGLLPLTDTDAYIYGTSSIPGRQIGVHAYLCGQEVKFGAKASNQANGAGSYNWLVEVELFDPDVNVGNEFYQYLDVSDGFSSGNFTLLSDSNNVPVPPMSLTLPAGLVDTTAYGCGYAQWDGTSLTTALVELTIEGHTNNAQAFNNFGQAYDSSGWVDFEIDAVGDFSFPVALYDGYNSVQVDDGHGGNFGVEIVTANGQLRPQFLIIRNPIANEDSYAVSADETLTVSGDFANFSPDFLYGHASYCVPDGQGDCLHQSVSYDSDLTVANEWGDLPMDFNPGDVDFAFDLALPLGAIDVYIDVSGCGPEGCHGHSIYVNDGNNDYGDNYYKPGSRASSVPRYAHRQTRH